MSKVSPSPTTIGDTSIRSAIVLDPERLRSAGFTNVDARVESDGEVVVYFGHASHVTLDLFDQRAIDHMEKLIGPDETEHLVVVTRQRVERQLVMAILTR